MVKKKQTIEDLLIKDYKVSMVSKLIYYGFITTALLGLATLIKRFIIYLF